MRVLLTGASGFVGRHAQRYLVDAGLEVHGIGNRPKEDWSAPCVRVHACDLTDSHAITDLVKRIGPTHLLHLAWYAVPGRFWTAAENRQWLSAGRTLIRAFADAGGQRAVFAGTCAEYAWTEEICTEYVTPLRPATLYGRCKLALQEEVASLALHSGFSFAWARLFFMYGEHEPAGRLVSSVTESLLQNREVACTDGRQIRDFMFVDDVAAALAALLLSPVEGPVNVAAGKAHAVADVIRLIGTATGRGHLIRWGARAVQPGEPTRIEARTERLNAEVGFVPAFTLETGLQRTVDWWRTEVARHA